MKNYILIGLAALVIGFLAAWFIKQPETKFLPGETITKYVDTCYVDKIIADVTTETTTKETGGVKKGKSTKDSSIPTTVEVTQKDSIYTTVFEKSYNTGLMRMKVKATVKAKSKATAKLDMEYELDTITLNSMVNTVTTVVVQKDTVDQVPTEIVKYVEIPSTKSTGAYLGLSGGMTLENKPTYHAGLNLSGERLGLTLYTIPADWKSFGIQLNTKLVKLKK